MPRGRRPRRSFLTGTKEAALDTEILAKVEELCGRFPEFALGEPGPSGVSLEVRTKNFAMYWDNHHDDGMVALWCKAPRGAQAALAGSAPERLSARLEPKST